MPGPTKCHGGTFIVVGTNMGRMESRPRIKPQVDDKLTEIMNNNDLPNRNEAIRYALREAGYDV